MSDLSVKALRICAVILALITAGIHFRYAFGRFTPLAIAFAVMGVIYVVGAVMILWGKPLFFKLMLVYTVAIIIIYLYAIIQPLPPFTERAICSKYPTHTRQNGGSCSSGCPRLPERQTMTRG